MTEPFSTTLAERFTTIIHSRQSGRWGSFLFIGEGRSLATADGVTIIAYRSDKGWQVTDTRRPHMQGFDLDLETAIDLAINN